VTYKIDDGTGTIEVKQWIDPDNENDAAKGKIMENNYVRVWGRLKSFGNKRHVGAHVIRPISDFNEISYHLLEATAVHLFFARGPPSGAKGGANVMNGGQDTHMSNGGDFGIGGGLPAGLSVAAKKVYHCLATTPQSNEGLHEQDVASRLNMNVAEVNAGADQLLEQGLIYSTVDEHTWAILNADGIGI
jgi:replication factor A2